jgi:chromosome segregation ATPase
MSFGKQVLVLMILGSLGLWGCAQAPGSANAERIKALESKIAKLEEDFKSAVSVREQYRRKLASAEEDKTQLSQQVEQLQAVVKERDDLRRQLVVRTSERDSIQQQFHEFRKGIRTLLGKVETPSSQPVTSAAAPTTSNKG